MRYLKSQKSHVEISNYRGTGVWHFLDPGAGLQWDQHALCAVLSSRTHPNARAEAASP